MKKIFFTILFSALLAAPAMAATTITPVPATPVFGQLFSIQVLTDISPHWRLFIDGTADSQGTPDSSVFYTPAITLGSHTYEYIILPDSDSTCELSNYDLSTCAAAADATYSITGHAGGGGIGGILNLGDTASIFSPITSLFSDLWALIAIAIGVPLAFYVIKQVIAMVPKAKAKN
jgi:hypothetical protein